MSDQRRFLLAAVALVFVHAGNLQAGLVDVIDGETWPAHEHLEEPGDHGHASHWTWRSTPPDDVTSADVFFFIHDHGGSDAITSEMGSRIRDAAMTLDGDNSGALINLTEAASDGSGTIHIHNDSIDGAGGTLGQANTFFLNHGATDYSDGHSFHQIVSSTPDFITTVTMDSAENWYTGTGSPGDSQFDYWSVALHEVFHSLGAGHSDSSTEPNSVMLPTIGTGMTRRTLTSDDTAVAQHLYGNSTAVPEPSSLSLAGLGAAGLLSFGWRRKHRLKTANNREK